MRGWASALAGLFVLMFCADAVGQTPASTAEGAAPTEESLERIRKALDRPAALELEFRQPDFRAEIVMGGLRGDLFGPIGPNWVPPSGRTHYEFLQMVTPTDVQNPFSSSELAWVTATSIGTALAIHGLKTLIARRLDARRERRVNEIRLQIQRELADLERRRAATAR